MHLEAIKAAKAIKAAQAVTIVAVIALAGCSQHDSYNPTPGGGTSLAPAIANPPPVAPVESRAVAVPIVPSAPLEVPPTAPTPARFVLVANQCAGTVTELVRDATGAYIPKGDPVATGGKCPWALVADPAGRFLFCANRGSDDITVFTIDKETGLLAVASQTPAGGGPAAVAISPDGTRLVVANQCDATVGSYTIDAATGALAPASLLPLDKCMAPTALAFDPSGKSFYVVGGPKGFAGEVTIDPAGNLMPATAVAIGCHPSGIAVDQKGAHVCVVCDDPDDVLITLAHDATGQLVASAPVPVGADPSAIVVSPDGKLAYVATRDTNTVLAFALDDAGVATSVGEPGCTGKTPRGLALDAAGGTIFTADACGGTVSVLPLDAGTRLPKGGAPVALPAPADGTCLTPRALALVK